jgi:hypothetical protein
MALAVNGKLPLWKSATQHGSTDCGDSYRLRRVRNPQHKTLASNALVAVATGAVTVAIAGQCRRGLASLSEGVWLHRVGDCSILTKAPKTSETHVRD